jgi:hypothetical protein
MISVTDRSVEIGRLKRLVRGFEVFIIGRDGEAEYVGKSKTPGEATALIHAARAASGCANVSLDLYETGDLS